MAKPKHTVVIDVGIYQTSVTAVFDRDRFPRIADEHEIDFGPLSRGKHIYVYSTDVTYVYVDTEALRADTVADAATMGALAVVAAHEAFHAAFHILHVRGVVLDVDHDEAHAYLVGYLTGQLVTHALAFAKARETKIDTP